ncbi:hypothetical protein BC940DRAFT_319403 [Gongronella butleri]|nr:hypothetical protein BC940DRAFT_319403 [Gongronella butleri]
MIQSAASSTTTSSEINTTVSLFSDDDVFYEYLLRKVLANPTIWQLTGFLEAVSTHEETVRLAVAAVETAKMRGGHQVATSAEAATRGGDMETVLAQVQHCLYQAEEELRAVLTAAERYSISRTSNKEL